MEFQKQVFNYQIYPVIQTEAIQKLTLHLKERFNGDNLYSVITCFDVNGSGKETTIKEACLQANASKISISRQHSTLLNDCLNECRILLLDDRTVDDVFTIKFEEMICFMLQSMAKMLDNTSDLVYANIDDRQNVITDLSISQSYEYLESALLDRKLVIHISDAQLFIVDDPPKPKAGFFQYCPALS